MEDREPARMRKYGESKTTRIMMATVPHVTSGSGLRKFQAGGFLLTQVYKGQHNNELRSYKRWYSGKAVIITYSECVSVALFVQRAMRMRHIVACGPHRSTALSTGSPPPAASVAPLSAFHLAGKLSQKQKQFKRLVNNLCHWRFKFQKWVWRSLLATTSKPAPRCIHDANQWLPSAIH